MPDCFFAVRQILAHQDVHEEDRIHSFLLRVFFILDDGTNPNLLVFVVILVGKVLGGRQVQQDG